MSAQNKSATDTAKSAAKDTGSVAKQKFEEVKETARTVASEQVDAAKAKASEAVNEAKTMATTKAEQARDGLAAEGEALADGLRATASDLQDNSLHARGLEQVADTVSSAANAVRGTDVDAVISDISGYAQRNPLLFLAGAAALGFAATRFLKASQPYAPGTTAQIDTSGHARPAAGAGDPDWARHRS